MGEVVSLTPTRRQASPEKNRRARPAVSRGFLGGNPGPRLPLESLGGTRALCPLPPAGSAHSPSRGSTKIMGKGREIVRAAPGGMIEGGDAPSHGVGDAELARPIGPLRHQPSQNPRGWERTLQDHEARDPAMADRRLPATGSQCRRRIRAIWGPDGSAAPLGDGSRRTGPTGMETSQDNSRSCPSRALGHRIHSRPCPNSFQLRVSLGGLQASLEAAVGVLRRTGSTGRSNHRPRRACSGQADRRCTWVTRLRRRGPTSRRQ